MRYIPYVGTFCKFTFTEQFQKLDGVYNVTQVLSYDQALSDDIDFAKNLYAPAGLDESKYDTDVKLYKGDDVLVLVSTVDSTTLYVFSSLVLNVPDPTVKQYDHLVLVGSLGYFKDISEISWILEEVNNTIIAVTGSDGYVDTIVDPSVKRVWLTDSEYKTLESDREAKVQKLNPLRLQYAQLLDQYNQLKIEHKALKDQFIKIANKE